MTGWPPPKDVIIRSFNARADTYDFSEYHRWLARRAVAEANVRTGMAVLDAAAGTGLAVREAARLIGYAGTFWAVDIAVKLLAVAQREAAAQGFTLNLLEADICDIPLPNASVDVVLCVSALAYVNDPAAAFSEWRRLLRPRGEVLFQTMAEGAVTASRVLRRVAAEFGVELTDPNESLGTEDRCRAALDRAGMDCLSLTRDVWSEALPTALAAWNTLRKSTVGRALEPLPPDRQDALRERFCSAFQREYDRLGGVDRQTILLARGA